MEIGEWGSLRRKRVAFHGGPESCVGVREGVGEALAGIWVGREIPGYSMPARTQVVTSLVPSRGDLDRRSAAAARERSLNNWQLYVGRTLCVVIDHLPGQVVTGTALLPRVQIAVPSREAAAGHMNAQAMTGEEHVAR